MFDGYEIMVNLRSQSFVREQKLYLSSLSNVIQLNLNRV